MTALTATQVAAHFNASGNSRPAAPTNVSATAGANQATVSWTASTTSAGAPVTGYLVTAYIGTQPQNSLGVSGTTTSVTLTGLRGATSYTFQVVASNNFGNSPPSAAWTAWQL